MAHGDCWSCGGSIHDYPNCCQETQDYYIDMQREEWALDKAREQLNKKHSEELSNLAKIWLASGAYENDEIYLKHYLKRVKKIKGTESK